MNDSFDSGLDGARSGLVEWSKTTTFTATAASIGRTGPRTTRRARAAAAIIVVHGRQSWTNRAIGQSIGNASTGTTAHLPSKENSTETISGKQLKNI